MQEAEDDLRIQTTSGVAAVVDDPVRPRDGWARCGVRFIVAMIAGINQGTIRAGDADAGDCLAQQTLRRVAPGGAAAGDGRS